MNIITVINAKGGCGKSTIAMNVAAGLANRGHGTADAANDRVISIIAVLHAARDLSTLFG